MEDLYLREIHWCQYALRIGDWCRQNADAQRISFAKTCFQLEQAICSRVNHMPLLTFKETLSNKELIYGWQTCLWRVDKRTEPASHHPFKRILLALVIHHLSFQKNKKQETTHKVILTLSCLWLCTEQKYSRKAGKHFQHILKPSVVVAVYWHELNISCKVGHLPQSIWSWIFVICWNDHRGYIQTQDLLL